MLPDESQRVVTFNRTDKFNYIEWMCKQTGIPFKAEMMRHRNRIQIDEVFMKYLPEYIESEIVEEPEVVDLPILPEPELFQINRPQSRMSRLGESESESEKEETTVVVEETPTWVEAALEVEGVEEIVEEFTELDAEDGDSEDSDVGVDEHPVVDIQEEGITPPIQTIEANSMFQSNDYNSWTVVELREECRKRDITIRGTKAEVVLRLRQDDEGPQSNQDDVTETPVTPVTAVEEALDAPVDTAATEVEEDANSGQKQNNESNE
jgi:hypothetical protein